MAPSSISFVSEFANPSMKFVASAPEGVELLSLAAPDYRIIDAPMQAIGGAGKDGTALVCMIANRDDVIERCGKKLVQ